MLPKLHTILDPARKQKTIITSSAEKVRCTMNSNIPEDQIPSFISGLGRNTHVPAHTCTLHVYRLLKD
jgi:hypothetical protein